MSDWNETAASIRAALGNTEDAVLDAIAGFGDKRGLLLYLSSLSKTDLVVEHLIRPLQQRITAGDEFENLEAYRSAALGGLSYRYANEIGEAVEETLQGGAALFLEGESRILVVSIGGMPTRAIGEPKVQTSIFGPKEGFVEAIDVNISLLRRRIRNADLRFVPLRLGGDNRARASLVCMEGKTDKSTIAEVRKRLERIRSESTFDTNQLMLQLNGRKKSKLFPVMLNIERPDAAAHYVLEGKLALLVDGSPYAVVTPVAFDDFFHFPEDRYMFPAAAKAVLALRYVAFLVSLLLPGLYIGLANYNVEILPITLMMAIAGQRTDAPFPSVIELLMVELIFELIWEATTRMPRAVGGALTIVGALVIGQAAVEAGIITNIIIIIVAMRAVTGYAIPYDEMVFLARFLRVSFVLAAAVFGLYGVFLGIAALICYVTSLRSFNRIPYFKTGG
jgi:spore germination protein KA